MGETVSRKAQEVSRVFLNDPLLNLEQFDPNLMGAADCCYIVLTKKLSKKALLRGLNLRKLRHNQTSILEYVYQNVRQNGSNSAK